MNETDIGTQPLSPDVIGLSVGMGITMAIAIASCACAYVYRRKQHCPYCNQLFDQNKLQEHLSSCPKHLEFWKKSGPERSDSFMYIRK